MLERETTVNTRTTDTIQRNHASHASTVATRSNIGASFSDLLLSKKNVATESLVSTLDNVTFSFKNFEYRVHEHFLCWRQVNPSSQECTVVLQLTVGRTSAPPKPFSCCQFNSATSCEKVAPTLRFLLSVLPASTLLILLVHKSAVLPHAPVPAIETRLASPISCEDKPGLSSSTN